MEPKSIAFYTAVAVSILCSAKCNNISYGASNNNNNNKYRTKRCAVRGNNDSAVREKMTQPL